MKMFDWHKDTWPIQKGFSTHDGDDDGKDKTTSIVGKFIDVAFQD